MRKDKLQTAKDALESAWVTVCAFAGGCWDTIDEIEEAIGSITGETSVQVNKRLYATNRQFLRHRDHRADLRKKRVEAVVSSFDSRVSEFGFCFTDRNAFEAFGPDLWIGRKVRLAIQPSNPPETVHLEPLPQDEE